VPNFHEIPKVAEVCVCVSVKRGLPYGKRDLLHAQKRPTDILADLSAASEFFFMLDVVALLTSFISSRSLICDVFCIAFRKSDHNGPWTTL